MSEEVEPDFSANNHLLVPKHELIDKKDVKNVLEKINASIDKFPYILVSDPAIKDIGAKTGDLIKVTRDSQTAGVISYYRFVVEG